jgi:hypothetical protein
MNEKQYDDWKLADGKEENIFGECEYCGEVIYVGEDYLHLRYNGAYIHTDGECYDYYIENFFSPIVKTAE